MNKTKLITPKIAAGVPGGFKDLVQKSTLIVDKSLLIKEFLEHTDDALLVTYPRRWGKSINISMLKSFLEIEVDEQGEELPAQQKQNHKLFENLAIWQEQELIDEHFGKYPVIHISFKKITTSSYEKLFEKVKQKIVALYRQFHFLRNSSNLIKEEIEDFHNYLSGKISEVELENALWFLSNLLAKHFDKKVVVLIDEYDAAINQSYVGTEDEKESKKVIEFFRELYGEVLKDNDLLHKGYVTGILRIAKANLFSSINNLGEYNIYSEVFAKYYGFNRFEMEYLFKQYRVPRGLQEEFQEWFNGYKVGELELYNPWAVVKSLNAFIAHDSREDKVHKYLKSYWEESGTMSFMNNILQIDSVKDKIHILIEGREIIFNIKEQFTVDDLKVLQKISNAGSNYKIKDQASLNLLFSYLFFAGYLTMLPDTTRSYKVPNHEIRHSLGQKVVQYYETIYNVDVEDFNKVSDIFRVILDKAKKDNLDSLFKQFREAFASLLSKFPKFEKITDSNIIEDSKENIATVHGNEDLVHSIMNYIALQVVSVEKFGTEVHLGDGRADIAFIDKKTQKAVIIEMKFHNDLEKALAQIKDKRYGQQLGKKYDCIIAAVSTDMDKNVELAYEFIPKQLAESGDVG